MGYGLPDVGIDTVLVGHMTYRSIDRQYGNGEALVCTCTERYIRKLYVATEHVYHP